MKAKFIQTLIPVHSTRCSHKYHHLNSHPPKVYSLKATSPAGCGPTVIPMDHHNYNFCHPYSVQSILPVKLE